MMFRQKTMTKIFLLALLVPGITWADREPSGEDLDIIELELEKSVSKKQKIEKPKVLIEEESSSENTLKDFSGLGRLSPFNEISVIQKKFLPKTGRFQFFGGATVVTNNPFFNTLGFVAKGSYYLTESWGVELNYFGLSTSERQITQELRDIQSVDTHNLVYPQSFVGADIKFVPVYGKLALYNKKIVPFDLYFSAGYGITNTQAGENAGTAHLATGQIFALSKSYAFRWDFSWNFYNAKSIDGTTSMSNNLFLTAGMSWFFPEANYR